MPKAKLFLIDAHGLCYRSYFAIKGLSTSSGQATNAVYGFTNTLRKILRDFKPEYLAVCFDVGKKTRRQERFAEYKIHRPSMPEDLISQLPLIKDVVSAFRLPIFELEGFEADDVIATIAQKVSKEDIETVIVSADKDMLQLVDRRVKVWNVQKDMMIGSKEAKEMLGIEPDKVTDYLGLAGDQSDNIPGVLGIGEVTARDLINEYGTIEHMLAHIDKLKSEKIKEKLLAQKDMAIFSKELATLDARVPIKFTLEDLRVSEPDNRRLSDLFQNLEFRKFAEEFSSQTTAEKKIPATTVETDAQIESLLAKIREKEEMIFLFDLPEGEESAGGLFGGMSISLGAEDHFYLASPKVKSFKEIFEDEAIVKVSHNIKSAMHILAREKIDLKGKAFDVMLAGYLLSPSQGGFDIPALAWMFLKAPLSVGDDAASRAQSLFRMYELFKKELVQKSLFKLFEEIEMPLAHVLFCMEEEGVCLDEALLKKLSRECDEKIKALVSRIYKMAGAEFNLNSPKQLSHVLFEKLKLPVVRKTKTGFSTDEGVLMRLAKKHDMPALILDYRQLAKLKSTYIDALPKLVHAKTKRLHTSFNQTGTETGRLSSNNPNLQNIPIRTELGAQIRKAFIASGKHNTIISADYSQIELRILAHLSKDENLIKAFKRDQDIHAFTAALIFDVKEDEVTSSMRDAAKRVNFGIIYGISAFGLSKDLEITHEEAQAFIDRYFARYPCVKKFMDNEIKKAQENGFVLTLMNRRRYLPDIKSSNMAVRQFSERQAINTPVQGSAADLIKLAMINIQRELEKRKLESKMIITVHDELVFDVTEKEKPGMIEFIRDQMEHSIALSVPIKVTVKAGANWLDMEEV